MRQVVILLGAHERIADSCPIAGTGWYDALLLDLVGCDGMPRVNNHACDAGPNGA